MNTTLASKNRLEEYGIKPSLQRMAIMEYLMTHDNHPTADVIFNELSPSIPTLSKTTVYNTLKLLAEQEAILSICIDEKNIRYDGDISHHAHFKCKVCGEIYDIKTENSCFCKSKCVEGFIITESRAYYKGYCKKCKKLMPNN
jgi:Fur family ferric uptake transcriptional regulator/Fur family peroxide stress response transcriptional regulator